MTRPSRIRLRRVAALSAAFLLPTCGCSTIVNLGRTSGLDVRSDPPGAAVFVDGVRKGTTPVAIDIDGGAAEHVVRIEKPGYEAVERTVKKGTDPWVWGNAPFAVFPLVAVAGLGVDAYSGSWYRVEPAELDARLRAVSVRTAAPAPSADKASSGTRRARSSGSSGERLKPARSVPASPSAKPAKPSGPSDEDLKAMLQQEND